MSGSIYKQHAINTFSIALENLLNYFRYFNSPTLKAEDLASLWKQDIVRFVALKAGD